MISFTSEQLAAWYGALFWPLVRVLALISVAPLLSHRAVPLRIKLALAVGVTAVLVPTVPSPPITMRSAAPASGCWCRTSWSA